MVFDVWYRPANVVGDMEDMQQQKEIIIMTNLIIVVAIIIMTDGCMLIIVVAIIIIMTDGCMQKGRSRLLPVGYPASRPGYEE